MNCCVRARVAVGPAACRGGCRTRVDAGNRKAVATADCADKIAHSASGARLAHPNHAFVSNGRVRAERGRNARHVAADRRMHGRRRWRSRRCVAQESSEECRAIGTAWHEDRKVTGRRPERPETGLMERKINPRGSVQEIRDSVSRWLGSELHGRPEWPRGRAERTETDRVQPGREVAPARLFQALRYSSASLGVRAERAAPLLVQEKKE